jgi:anaerobic selenocysteine-containing dehydrogenase
VLAEVAEVVAGAGTRFACHSWRSAAAGNLGGWQVSRTLFLISALLGAVATEGGTFPNAWNKFVPRPIHTPPHPGVWQDLSWPLEFPLAQNEMSFLLPHFLKDGRGRLDTYFTRVYNPVWTNPDGLSWMEVLTDEQKVGCYVALTPTWNESAYFADYVLPMGHGSERHDTHSYEQYDGQWIGFRQPVLRAARERLGEDITDTRQVNPGEVWEENEWWTELSWRIDPDGSMGIRQYHESRAHPGEKLTVDEYYGWMFENSVPGLPERAAAEGLSPLAWMRRYGAFEIAAGQGALHEREVPDTELRDVAIGPAGQVYTAAAPRPVPTSSRWQHPTRTARDAARPAYWWTGASGGDSPRPRAGSNSGPPHWRTGAGPNMPCPATSRATSTPPRWLPIRWCCCPRSGCPPRSTPAPRTANGWTSCRTPTRSGSTPATPPGSASPGPGT